MIWGLTLREGFITPVEVKNEELHLSMAALKGKTITAQDSRETEVFIHNGDSSYLLCTLVHGMIYQQYLELTLHPQEKLSFSVTGHGTVHITGYTKQYFEDDLNIEPPVPNNDFDNQEEYSTINTQNKYSDEFHSVEATDEPEIMIKGEITNEEEFFPVEESAIDINQSDVEVKENSPKEIHNTQNEHTISHEHQTPPSEIERFTPINVEMQPTSFSSDFQSRLDQNTSHQMIHPQGLIDCSVQDRINYSQNIESQLILDNQRLCMGQSGSMMRHSTPITSHHQPAVGLSQLNNTNCAKMSPLNKGHQTVTRQKSAGRLKAVKKKQQNAAVDAYQPITVFKCRHCDKIFPTKSQLKTHELIHSDIKGFQCRYCNKQFTYKCNWKSHERIHTGHRPFKCHYCDKTFIQSSHLKSHELIHVGNKAYSCKFCGKQFYWSYICKKHEQECQVLSRHSKGMAR